MPSTTISSMMHSSKIPFQSSTSQNSTSQNIISKNSINTLKITNKNISNYSSSKKFYIIKSIVSQNVTVHPINTAISAGNSSIPISKIYGHQTIYICHGLVISAELNRISRMSSMFSNNTTYNIDVPKSMKYKYNNKNIFSINYWITK